MLNKVMEVQRVMIALLCNYLDRIFRDSHYSRAERGGRARGTYAPPDDVVGRPALWLLWRWRCGASRTPRPTVRTRGSASLPWRRVEGNAPYQRHDCGDMKRGRAVSTKPPQTARRGRLAPPAALPMPPCQARGRVSPRAVPVLLHAAYLSIKYCNMWQCLLKDYCSMRQIMLQCCPTRTRRHCHA